MKYIRTKDNILVNDLYEHNENEYKELFANVGLEYISQADTIEELCDCVVYDCLPKPYQSVHQKHEVDDVESLKWNRNPERFENVYGAIWTDKGLIYVAKMNDKGVLELL